MTKLRALKKSDVEPYLNYLDKEMTIMGILSAVSIATPAGVLKVLFDNMSGIGGELWSAGNYFVLTGSVFGILAAGFFYKQRSTLAWFYGQICLTDPLYNAPRIEALYRELLRQADSWETWWPYDWGFVALFSCFAEYIITFGFYLYHLHPKSVDQLIWDHRRFAIWCAYIAVVIPFAALQKHVHIRYKYSESYWSAFGEDLKNWGLPRRTPHDGVYTRLSRSPIAGVGVFALCEIKSGTYIFEPDDGKIVSIPKSSTEELPAPIKKLYQDFCVLEEDTYICPQNFNSMTISWYLNHSEQPNVATDLSLKFYVLRDIKAGEELTSDYESYSDNGI